MRLSFISTDYEDSHDCVSWSGLRCADNKEFSEFLATKVADRLNDTEGNNDFRSHLNGLALTGMGKDSLAAVLISDHPEERSWAAGEALAEAFLEADQKVIFPWNMERDKRNPYASLPGADIVGFVGVGDDCKFALGEVKSSSEQAFPPQVMSGRSGHMGHQLDNLAHNLTSICQLLRWLLPRTKGTTFQASYNKAAENFFNSGNKNIALFGILIRDTKTEHRDLSVRGCALRQAFNKPTTCQLKALYLPWRIDQLINKIRKGGES